MVYCTKVLQAPKSLTWKLLGKASFNKGAYSCWVAVKELKLSYHNGFGVWGYHNGLCTVNIRVSPI